MSKKEIASPPTIINHIGLAITTPEGFDAKSYALGVVSNLSDDEMISILRYHTKASNAKNVIDVIIDGKAMTFEEFFAWVEEK